LIFTGVIPLGPTAKVTFEGDGSDAAVESEKQKARDIGHATATVAVAFQALTAFYLYMQLTSSGFSFAFSAGLLGNTALFCFGVWTLLFAGEKGRVSRSTGADKRTSNFPFENKESAREKKKESKGRKSILKSR
jgi:hypothetical protein